MVCEADPCVDASLSALVWLSESTYYRPHALTVLGQPISPLYGWGRTTVTQVTYPCLGLNARRTLLFLHTRRLKFRLDRVGTARNEPATLFRS